MGGRRIMAKFNNGYENIKVSIINWPGNDIAKNVYEFGQLSHDFYMPLPDKYDEYSPECSKLIDKIIEGTTLPKFALNQRIEFKIENISRICLAQLTRDCAIFASASTGVFPLTQEFNIPMNLYEDEEVMSRLTKAQELLEEAYIIACEKEYPTIESRYVGLHPQVISLTASYTISDFVRSCYSRTSSNFCDECNYVYRLMYRALMYSILNEVGDANSVNLYNWLLPENKCINDSIYKRERLYNSDFTAESSYVPDRCALNDWRKSGWRKELRRMYETGKGWLTEKELNLVLNDDKREDYCTYDNTKPDVAVNLIKTMDYYKEV